MELATTGTVSIVNPDIGDIALSDNGTEIAYTALKDEVAQRLRVRLNFFMGEWFLNLNAGVPYYQHVLIKGPSELVIRTVISQVLQQTEGVDSIISLTYDHNRAARSLAITFKLRLKDGATFVSTEYPPFVLAA